MNKVTVHWDKPRKMSDVIKDDRELDAWAKPGIYMWLHPHCKEEQKYEAKHVAYVGRALGSPDVLTRLREHYVLYLGGRYCVRGEYRDGTDKTYVPNQYSDPDYQELIADEDRYAQLLREARRFANSYMVAAALKFDAEIEYDWDRTELLKRLERQMIYDFKPRENTQGVRTPPTITLELKHINKPWEALKFTDND